MGNWEIHTKLLMQNLKGIGFLGDIDVDGRIRLK
jgi:hypothetical protein